MKIINNARAFGESESETVLPFVSGNSKSGAFVPSGNIVELTATMPGIWCGLCPLSNENLSDLAQNRFGFVFLPLFSPLPPVQLNCSA